MTTTTRPILTRIDALPAGRKAAALRAVHNLRLSAREAALEVSSALDDGRGFAQRSMRELRESIADGTISVPFPKPEPVKLGRLDKSVSGLNIVTLDIETKPMQSFHFGMWDQNIGLGQVIEHGDILSVGHKALGKPVEHVATWDEGGYEGMIRAVHKVLDDADVLVTYNGIGFDEKKLNWAFARMGLDSPSPFKSVDLLRVVRRRFAPDSKKLDHVAQMLGLGNKLSTGGFDLWRGAMNGDPKAQAKMERYCKQDVRLTEKLYLRLLPWLPTGVSLPQLAGNGFGCPTCGSPKLAATTKSYTAAASTYDLLKCSACGSFARGTRSTQRTALRAA